MIRYNETAEPSDRDGVVEAKRSRPESAVLVDSLHTEIDRLEKALQALIDRIEPALSPSLPTDTTDEAEGKAAPRSNVIEGLNGIGRHIQLVRVRVENVTERVDL